MGMTLIYGLIFLLIFLGIAVRLFIRSSKKKSLLGKTISIVMILVVILVLLTNTFDQMSISKRDILSDLKYADIELNDDFEISHNTVSGMPERIQETEIIISNKDRDRILNKLSKSNNCKMYREFSKIEKYDEIDNIPTRICVYIYYKTNILTYQRIED